MARIVDLIVERFGLPRIAIYLAAGDTLVLAGSRGHQHALQTLSRGDTMVERVANARQPVFVPSFSHDAGQAGAGRGVATELSVPLIVDGELAGLLNVASLLVAPIGEADVAVIRLVSERLTAALSLVHERASAQAKLARARRESSPSGALMDGAAAVYRHSMLEPLLDAAIAAAGPKGTRKPGMLVIGRNDTTSDAMDRLEGHARVAFADRPLVRGPNGELVVLMLGIGVAVGRSEARHFVDAAKADGLDVWCGYASASGRSTAADLSAAAELSLVRAQALEAGTIIG
jgi:putative methionine-R-sulfoxide reductase with GAF domain